MNLFGFLLDDSIIAECLAFFYGMAFGLILTLLRFIIFTAFERNEA
jgi:hypothetical protein